MTVQTYSFTIPPSLGMDIARCKKEIRSNSRLSRGRKVLRRPTFLEQLTELYSTYLTGRKRPPAGFFIVVAIPTNLREIPEKIPQLLVFRRPAHAPASGTAYGCARAPDWPYNSSPWTTKPSPASCARPHSFWKLTEQSSAGTAATRRPPNLSTACRNPSNSS